MHSGDWPAESSTPEPFRRLRVGFRKEAPAHDQEAVFHHRRSRQTRPWSLTKPGEPDVHFRVEGDALSAQILCMDEEPDGFSFKMRGKLTSGRDQGSAFHGFYSVETRSGWLELR